MLKLNNILNIILINLLLIPFCSQAGSFCTKSSSRDLDLHCDIEETDLYVGVGVGRIMSAAKSFNFQQSSSSSSLGILVGKRLNDTYSFETQYLQAGILFDPASSNSTEVNIFSFTGIGRIPLDSGHYISVYGRFGWSVSYVTIQGVGNNWHGDLTYGTGIEVGLGSARNWFMRLGIDEYHTGALSVLVPGQPVPRDKLDNFSVTLLLNF